MRGWLAAVGVLAFWGVTLMLLLADAQAAFFVTLVLAPIALVGLGWMARANHPWIVAVMATACVVATLWAWPTDPCFVCPGGEEDPGFMVMLVGSWTIISSLAAAILAIVMQMVSAPAKPAYAGTKPRQ